MRLRTTAISVLADQEVCQTATVNLLWRRSRRSFDIAPMNQSADSMTVKGGRVEMKRTITSQTTTIPSRSLERYVNEPLKFSFGHRIRRFALV